MTSKNQNDLPKITQVNSEISGSNATILGKMTALRKMMVTLSQQVSTMSTTNNNIGGSGEKKKHVRSLPLQLAYYWSHIWYKQISKECNRKNTGQIDTPTKNKLQGRNTRGL